MTDLHYAATMYAKFKELWEFCERMASTAKTPQQRQEWLEGAARWERKIKAARHAYRVGKARKHEQQPATEL